MSLQEMMYQDGGKKGGKYPPLDFSPKSVSESTSTNVPVSVKSQIGQLKQQAEVESDLAVLKEVDFREKYNTSKHRYKYENYPEYKTKVEQKGKRTSKQYGSADYPSTDVRSKKYSGAPNLAFMNPKGLTGEALREAEEYHTAIIGAALPIPGVQAMGKVPGVASAGKKLVNLMKKSKVAKVADPAFKSTALSKVEGKIAQLESGITDRTPTLFDKLRSGESATKDTKLSFDIPQKRPFQEKINEQLSRLQYGEQVVPGASEGTKLGPTSFNTKKGERALAIEKMILDPNKGVLNIPKKITPDELLLRAIESLMEQKGGFTGPMTRYNLLESSKLSLKGKSTPISSTGKNIGIFAPGEGNSVRSHFGFSGKEFPVAGDKTIGSEAWLKRYSIFKDFIENLSADKLHKGISVPLQKDIARMYRREVGKPYTGKKAFQEISPHKEGGRVY